MALANHKFNRFFIEHFGRERVKAFLEKYEEAWRISRGGLECTMLRIEARELHGKAPVSKTAAQMDCCKNTVYKAQNSKENSDVPQNELCLLCCVDKIFLY